MVSSVYSSFPFFTRWKTMAHKTRTSTNKRKTRTGTNKITTQWQPPKFLSCKLNAWSFWFVFLRTCPLSSSCAYRSLAASSLSTCSCRSLRFTLSNCQGPRLAGIDVTGSQKGKKWKNAGNAGKGGGKTRDGQKGRFWKKWDGGGVVWAKRVSYEVECVPKLLIWIVTRLALKSQPIQNDLNVTM